MLIRKDFRLFIFTLIIFIFGCGETKDVFYANIDAAKKAGEIERGWIPNILPESSSEIYEKTDIDSNQVWLRFKFDKKDIKNLLEQVKEVAAAEINTIKFNKPCNIIWCVNWWPRNLNKESFNKQSVLKIYRYNRVLTYSDSHQKTVPSFFVIDWKSNIAYYWQYAL